MVEPEMYRCVVLSTLERATALKQAIFAAKARGNDTATWVRTIDLARGRLGLECSNQVITILQGTSNLRELSIRGIVAPGLVEALIQCCPSLRTLRLWVDLHDCPTMEMIGSLKNIEWLQITSRRRGVKHDNVATGPFAHIPPWTLDKLVGLDWTNSHGGTFYECAFFSRCFLPRLKTLRLCIDPKPSEMPFLSQILTTHPGLTNLTLSIADELLTGLAPSIRCPSVLLTPVPDAAIALLLRPEVKTLKLDLQDVHWGDEPRLWALLSAFASLDHSHVEHIKLIRIDSEPAAHRTGEASFKDLLYQHILRLNRRGIRVYAGDCEELLVGKASCCLIVRRTQN
jgi:hypothetical protein